MRLGRTVAALALAFGLTAAIGLAGCKSATPGDSGPWAAGSFAAGQVLKYDVAVTVDGRSGTGSLSFTVTSGDGGALRVAYEGKGPGIAGAPVYDGHAFSGSALVADPANWAEAITGSLDGSSSAMTKPLLQDWNGLFANQTSWAAGATWQTADGATVSLTEKETYAGIEGLAGSVAAKSIDFCVAEDVPLPLHAKVVDNGVTLEYSLVEGSGF